MIKTCFITALVYHTEIGMSIMILLVITHIINTGEEVAHKYGKVNPPFNLPAASASQPARSLRFPTCAGRFCSEASLRLPRCSFQLPVLNWLSNPNLRRQVSRSPGCSFQLLVPGAAPQFQHLKDLWIITPDFTENRT